MCSRQGLQSLQPLFCSQTVAAAELCILLPPVICTTGGFFGSQQVEVFTLDRDWGVPVLHITVL